MVQKSLERAHRRSLERFGEAGWKTLECYKPNLVGDSNQSSEDQMLIEMQMGKTRLKF